MYTTIFVILFLMAVFLHEYGHLSAMHKNGIKVNNLSIGVPIGPMIVIRHPKLCFGIPVQISPFLIMGSVRPENPEEIDELSFDKQLEIYGGGIVMNCLFSIFLLLSITKKLWVAVSCLILGIVILKFRAKVCTYVLPLLSAFAVVIIPWLVMTAAKMVPDAGQNSSLALQEIAEHVSDLRMAVLFASVSSVCMAVFNLVPLMPLDGGRLVLVYFKKWFPEKLIRVYTGATIVVTLAIMLISTYDFIFAVLRSIWRHF